jgi:hypothetical protein
MIIKMLLEIVFDKTAFVKQNIDETHSEQPKSVGKSIPAYGFLKSQDKNPANRKS